MDSYSPERRIPFERRFLNKKRVAAAALLGTACALFFVLRGSRRS